MHPILFEWGDFFLPAWHTMYVLGAIAAYYLMDYLAVKNYPNLLDRKEISNLYIASYLGGYFGARFLSIIIEEDYSEGIGYILQSLFSFGAMTFYGGFIGAFLVGYIFIVIRKNPAGPVLDVTLPSGFLALAIGRIGCFLNGDDFGKPIPPEAGAPWWGVTFPNLKDGLLRYPTQLFETLIVGFMVLVLVYNFKAIVTRLGSGRVAGLSVLGYGIHRFFNEYLRGDERGWVIENVLSPSQFISIFLILGGLISVVTGLLKRPAK